MKKLLLVLFALVMMISAFAFSVMAESKVVSDDADVVETSSEISDESTDLEAEDDLGTVELEFYGFGEDGFMRNIKYMGLGMLGIFVVVGIVILLTFLLNNVTSKK